MLAVGSRLGIDYETELLKGLYREEQHSRPQGQVSLRRTDAALGLSALLEWLYDLSSTPLPLSPSALIRLWPLLVAADQQAGH